LHIVQFLGMYYHYVNVHHPEDILSKFSEDDLKASFLFRTNEISLV